MNVSFKGWVLNSSGTGRRFVAVCSLLVASLTGCDTLFPGPGGGASGGLTGLLPDGGVCQKDEQTIKNVMLAPPTCNATNPCPCGTFCSSQTGGNCVADCVDDSWCAPGHFCSGYGQCLAGSADGGTGDGPDPNVDPSCPRNQALLDSLEVMNRSCQFDDQCPFGSYCDHVKERCYADCPTHTDCSTLSTPGHTFVCGCLGKCAEVAAPRVPPSTVLPKLEVTPRQFIFPRPATITTPAWGTSNLRLVKLTVVSPFVTTSGSTITGPAVTVQANPGPGLMVQCPGAAMPSAGSCSIDIDPTTFVQDANGMYRSAEILVTLAPSPAAPTATEWDLRLSSNDLANVPMGVNLQYANQVGTPISQTFTPITAPPPSFLGSGTVELDTASGATLTIAVKAREHSGMLVLFDETRQLSPSGKLVLHVPTDTGAFQTFVNPELGNDVVLQDSLAGVAFQMIQDFSLQRSPASQIITGTFQRTVFTGFSYTAVPSTSPLDQPTTGRLRLMPDTSSGVGACGPADDCPLGMTCDLGFCSALPAHRFNPYGASQPDTDLMKHKRMTRWGAHRAGSTFGGDHTGYFGFYLPNSSYQGLAGDYRLHGPVPVVSGEPLADLFTPQSSGLLINAAPRAVPLLTQQDGAVQRSASALLRSCIADLSRDRKNPVPEVSASDVEAFDFDVECINLGRLVWALRDIETFQRALQGWLDVHSFVLGEGLEEMRLSEATAGIPGTVDPTNPPVPLEQLLGIGESGLGFLIDLSAAGSGPFKSFTGEQLAANVDYRPGRITYAPCDFDRDCNIGNGPPTMICDQSISACRLLPYPAFPQHEQTIGVPTKMLETATAYLKALEAYLARIARQTYGQPANANPSNGRQAALARFGAGMRLVLFAEQLAIGINNKAPCSANPANSSATCDAIMSRFATIRDEMNAVRVRVVAQAEAIRTGRNPFNIPEDDIPLFFGDPAGTNSQYFAASDYLLNSWAKPAVDRAASFLDAARSSWLAQLQAKVQDDLNEHNREQEINQLMTKYGAPILDACGGLQVPSPSGGLRQLESTEVIPYFASDPSRFDPKSCFMDPVCLGNEGVDGKVALKKVIDAAFIHPTGNLIETIDDPVTHKVEAAATFFMRSEICKVTCILGTQVGAPLYAQQLKQICPREPWESESPADHCKAFKGTDGNLYFRVPLPNNPVAPLAWLWGPISPSDIGQGRFYSDATLLSGPGAFGYFYEDLRSNTNRQISRTGTTYAENFLGQCKDNCSTGDWDDGLVIHKRMFNDYPRPDRTLLPSNCYKGSLGVQRYEMEGSTQRAQRARDLLLAGQKGLDDQFELCKTKDTNFASLQGNIDRYNNMRHWYHYASAVASAINFSFGSELFEIVQSFGFSQADHIEDLQHLESAFSHQEDIMACWNNFRSQQRALTAAADDVKAAAADMNAQIVRFRDTQTDTRLSLDEGIAVYNREKANPLSSLAHVFWVGEKVEQFRKEFEWARRLAFLAMRAVEFEFQQSLPFRSQIVAATSPAQLQDVVNGLEQEQAARTINRRRPEEASVVLSLRDDVLAIPDRSDDPAGERNWTPAARFASRLWDAGFAIHDRDGEYLGQGIPFTLGPTGVLETRCGERVWRVTATLQGDGIETSAPGASVLLLKRNTFSSQYCEGKSPRVTSSTTGATAPGPKLQTGVVHTAADLFKPGANVDLSDANEFTAALLYPWFNVRRTDFYKSTYRDGASEELAGRGLYGDYVLLFPKQVLEDGFSLDRVEDVLLRLDYLSVDNLSP